MFSIFINDLDDRTACTFSKFADVTELEGVADMPDGCVTIQKDLKMIEKQVNRNLMKLHKVKCKVLQRNNPNIGW